MNSVREISHIVEGKPTMEGAGVRLKRVFGYHEAKLMDPFLLLDHFGSDNPDDYIAGFPWHPHRGMETVTYMISGVVEHGDSLGNKGAITSGDVQWMTAGSGIIHQEMPQPFDGTMMGFQLWVNLPAADKMMDPRYRDITADKIPQVSLDGMDIKVIAGELEGVKGPARDLVIEPLYCDITLPPRSSSQLSLQREHTVFAFVFEGEGYFDEGKTQAVPSNHLALFDKGESIHISTGDNPMRFLLVSGMPLGEPIAWRGPIVMNTQEELELAFNEYRQGTFIKVSGH